MPNDTLRITGQAEYNIVTFPKKSFAELGALREQYPNRGPEYKTLYSEWHAKYAKQKYIRNPAFLKTSLRPLIPARGVNHNLITTLGDRLIVDMLSTTSVRTLADNANAVIAVGNGFTSPTKGHTNVNSISGTPEGMDATYPLQGGAWGNSGSNILIYQATYEAGDLNVVGLDETALSNGVDNLSYAALTPTTTVNTTDSLVMNWKITVLGS